MLQRVFGGFLFNMMWCSKDFKGFCYLPTLRPCLLKLFLVACLPFKRRERKLNIKCIPSIFGKHIILSCACHQVISRNIRNVVHRTSKVCIMEVCRCHVLKSWPHLTKAGISSVPLGKSQIRVHVHRHNIS